MPSPRDTSRASPPRARRAGSGQGCQRHPQPAAEGRITLQLDEGAPASARSTGLILAQPKEDFCIGHDNKVPVTGFTATSKFEGVIKALRVE